MNEILGEREQELFQACLEIAPAERHAFLGRECGNNAILRTRVKRLLAAHLSAKAYTLFPAIFQVSHEVTGIGQYRLLRLLGEGGMGTVYEAEQHEPVRRRVALKIVKLGMDTKEVVARFMTERQALAAMDHPYVAKVFDAGQTDSGRPYFAMELVDGTPLLEFCDTNRLSIRQRIELFVLVCQAVQHAHQKGVLHRDLKPSNVLVSGTAQSAAPKIIDFGIAKAIGFDTSEGNTEYTRADQALGTPAYMSPEQAGFGRMDIDTRTDVFSLGVMLYELLTGCLPADPADIGSARFLSLLAAGRITTARPSTRVCRAEETQPAVARSTTIAGLRRQLEGDLDWIVSKSLEVDRSRRYETAEALAEDLRRYLRGRPVSAHPPTIAYQLRKFVQRYRVQVLAAAIVILALLSGTVAAAIGFVHATRAKAVAREEAATARQVSDFLVQLFTLPNSQEAPTKPHTVRELLERGASTIERDLKGQPAVQANLFGTLSRVYEALGQYQEAKRFAEKALTLPYAKGRDGELQAASLLFQLGRTQQRLGNIAEASRLFEKSLAIRLRILGENHLDVAQSYNNVGFVQGLMEHYEEAASAHEKALAIQQRIGGPFQPDAARSLRGLALIQDREGNIEAGLKLFRDAAEIFEKDYGPNHPFTARALQDIAVSLKKLKRFDEAQRLLERSLRILQAVDGPDHPQLSFTEHSLGLVLIAQGKQKAALPVLQDAYRIRMASMGPNNPRTADVAESLAMLQVSLGELEKGRVLLESAWRSQEKAYGPNHSSTLETRGDLARTLVKARRYNEAIPHLRAVASHDVRPALRIDLQDPLFDPMRHMQAFQALESDARRYNGELPKR